MSYLHPVGGHHPFLTDSKGVSDEFEFGQQELNDPLDRTGLRDFTPAV
mgnify:CR=1 FL=1